MSTETPKALRPPNPYDFGSICQFLDDFLSLPNVYQEYRQVIMLSESKANEKISAQEQSAGAQAKKKYQMALLEQDAFEMAMLRAFWGLSTSLIEFKKKNQKDQDLKREFLHNENLGSLKNALTTAGFPELFGRNTLVQKLPEFNNFNLINGLKKAHHVFDRAFNFTFKDNEITRLKSNELLEKVQRFDTPDDIRLYLNVLVYKAEIATTEKSFNSMKRIINTGLVDILAETITKRDQLAQNPKIEEEESNEAIAYQNCRQKADLITESQELYFGSDDFIFVDKQLSHLKKGAKVEATEKNNKPILSDEFSAIIDERPLIQLITALKKVYNPDELYLVKHHLLRQLLADDPDKSEAAMSKFSAKKKLILDALKITRTDMMVEDVFNSATELKKNLIEATEKELLRNSVSQLKNEDMPKAEKFSGGLQARAKRAIERKENQAVEAQQEEEEKLAKEQNLGDNIKALVLGVFRYAQGKTQHNTFQAALEDLTPLLKEVLSILGGMEKGENKEKQKKQFKTILAGLYKNLDKGSKLDPTNHRALQMWLKGIIGRIDYV